MQTTERDLSKDRFINLAFKRQAEDCNDASAEFSGMPFLSLNYTVILLADVGRIAGSPSYLAVRAKCLAGETVSVMLP